MQPNEEITQTQNKTGERRTLVNFRPVLFCAFFFGLGVCFYKAWRCGASLWWLALLILPFFSLFLFKTKRELLRTLSRCLLLVFAFLIGMGAFGLHVYAYESGGKYNGDFFVVGRVEEYGLEGELCRVRLSGLEIDGNEEKGILVAYLPYTYAENLHLGDTLAMQGKVMRETLDFADEYFAYTMENDQRFQMRVDGVVKIGYEFRLFSSIRERITQVIYAGMDETPAAVTVAILTGDARLIDEGLLDNVRYGGIAHIFAVSGLHVGVLYGFCMALMKTKALKRTPKFLRFALVAATLLFYGGICGFSSSVLRATVTCLIAYAARLIGLSTDSGESIGAAALTVMLLSPVSLFTAGFQLSFAACFGIVWLFPIMKKAWIKPAPTLDDGNIAPLTLWQKAKHEGISFFAVTLSAQIATAPIQLIAFGYLSAWSLFLNCLFVPLISALFSLLLILVALACLVPISWAAAILYLPNMLWTVLLLAFQTLDFSKLAITGVQINATMAVCYYILCLLSTDKFNLPFRIRKILIFLAVLAFGIAMYALNTV